VSVFSFKERILADEQWVGIDFDFPRACFSCARFSSARF
jgi:hypothetical protein